MTDIFISYVRSDGERYAQVAKRLIAEELKADAFMDTENATDSPSLDDKIRSRIRESRIILAIITKDTQRSRWATGELRFALEQHKHIVVMLHIEGVLPLFLGNPEFCRFESPDAFANILREVLPPLLSLRLQVVIPAGGQGTGLYPLNEGMPKLLLPVDTKPILFHIFDSLDPDCFTRIRILTDRGFLPMIKYYVDLFKPKIDVSCELTTAQHLPQALKNLRADQRFLVYFSDVVIDKPVDWREFIRKHVRCHSEDQNVIGTFMATDVYRLPVGTIRPSTGPDQMDIVADFQEKPEERLGFLVNMAVAILEPELLGYADPSSTNLFLEPVQLAMRDGKRFRYHVHRGWHHIQTLDEWTRIQRKYVEKRGIDTKGGQTY